jgi:glycosyltransferase involved in cell wall biosynthesis
LRFLLAADNFTRGSGGAPRSAQEIVRALLSAGHQITILETGKPGGKMNWEGADHFRARLHGPLLPRDRDLRTVILNPRWQREVAALAAAFRPQLIITQGMLAPGAILAARAARVPCAYFFRGYAPLCPLHYRGIDPRFACTRPQCWSCLPLQRRVKYPLVTAALGLYDQALPQAELVVANSRYVAGLFQRFWKLEAEVLLPSLNIEVSPQPTNSPDGYLLFVKPQRAKGLDVLLGLARHMPQRSFAVAGEIRGSAARELGGLKNVQLLGWREDMDAVYRGARMILGPSEIPEPFGRVFLEAAARGCPTLAFNVGGIPEAVGPGGRLLPAGASIADWAGAITELDDPEQYQPLRLAALQQAARLAAADGRARAVELLERVAKAGTRPLPAPPDPDRKLKVVHLISALSLGGAELSLYHLVRGLDPDKFETRVICLREEGALAERFRAAGIEVELYKLPSRYSPLGLLGLARRLARSGADIVHTHLRRPNTSGRIAAWLADTPVIIAHERNPGPEKSRRHFMVDRWLARISAAVIAVSGHTAGRNSRLSGIPIDRFTVIPNAVDLEEYQPGDRAAARAALGLPAPDSDFLLGFAGRLHPVKNLEVLLRAVATAASEAPGLHLALAGDGSEREKLESLAAELGISERVTFLGQRSDLPAVYPAFDALCLVSRSEGCSRTMLEAAACGLPLLLTPVGYAPEMFEHNQSALFVKTGDADDLAAAIRKLAADTQLRAKLSEAATAAAANHGLKEYASKIERLYLELWNRASKNANR